MGRSGRRRSVIEEADRQKLISTFASRAIAAHKQSAENGMLCNKLPKSESTITLLSDERPLTTQNPLYQDGGSSSPEPSSEIHRPCSFLESDAPSPTSHNGQKMSWSLPSRLRGGNYYDALRRQALWDPAEWEEQVLKAGLKDSREELDADLIMSGRSTETKLSVREQARQFEQQALADQTPRSRDSYASLDLDDPFLSAIMVSYNPVSVGQDVPPCIIITRSDGETPPPPAAQRPTPPVVRKFSSSISSYVTVEPCEITLEIIPDPPDSPPPSPPPSPSSLSPPPLQRDPTPPPAASRSPRLPIHSPTLGALGRLRPVTARTTPELRGILKNSSCRTDEDDRKNVKSPKNCVLTQQESEQDERDARHSDLDSPT